MSSPKKKAHLMRLFVYLADIWMVEKQLMIKQAHVYLGGQGIELCLMQLVALQNQT